MATSFTSEYLTNSEYLTPFPLQKSAKFAIHARALTLKALTIRQSL
jgi:hypothetical protein